MRSLLRSPWVQALLAELLGGYLALALRTTRWTIEGREHFLPHAGGAPAIFAFWHEYLPLMPALPMLGRRQAGYRETSMHVLVSRHRDGRFIGAVVRRFGVRPILGSSSRGGAAGARNLLGMLSAGGIIAIAPDGPRGPRRQAAAGVAHLSALASVPVLPCAAKTSRAIPLNTWDRMAIPLPFARAIVVFGPGIGVSRDRWQDAVPAIAEALNRVAHRAEQLCRT